MDLRQLEHFLAVADRGSFTKAAADVHLVQSALSTSIRTLERELGTALFERTTRRVTLTAAGRALVPAAQRVLAATRSAREEVAAVTGLLSGELAVGTIQTLTSVDLPAVLARFHQSHPGIEITLHQARVPDLIDGLHAGELDLAYLARDKTRLPDDLTVISSSVEELVLVAAPGHPLAGEDGVDLASLSDQPFVDFQAGTGLQTAVEQLCAQVGLDRRISCRVTQIGLLISLVEQGLGIAIVPLPIAEQTRLAVVRLAEPRPSRSVALVTRAPQPANPAARALLAELVAAGSAPQRRG